MEVFARGGEALAQALREGRGPTRGLKAMLLTDSISIYCGLVFKVKGDRAEYLGESQSFEFSENCFRGESFIEALDNRIEGYARAGHIIAAVALFDVFFRHHANNSGVRGCVSRSGRFGYLINWWRRSSQGLPTKGCNFSRNSLV
jgi:hypothetical protein